MLAKRVATRRHGFPPLDPARAAFLEERLMRAAARQPALARLRDALLRHGGIGFVPPRGRDPDVAAVLAEGRTFEAAAAKRVRGRASDCHGNVSRLWAKRPDGFRIATGYALSEDGLWRSHTWGFEDERVVETTEERILYFGVVLAPRKAASFAKANG